MQEATQTGFHPDDYTAFEYTSFSINTEHTGIELNYRFVGKHEVAFTETVELPAADRGLDDAEHIAMQRTARLLFLAAGLSYYKAAAPVGIKIMPAVTKEEVAFLTQLIANGMTEFAYVNNLPEALHPIIEATVLEAAEPQLLPRADSEQPLVPIGGGKDSIVTLEALRATAKKPVLFSVNTFPAIERTVQVAGLPYLMAKRQLSPKLLEINSLGARNGHVPVTATVSLIAVLTALLHGQRAVIFSNERSASVGNVIWEGIEVNHQWSKSLAAEKLIRDTIQNVVTPDLAYFSLLRPFSELRITRQFAKYRQYHQAFTSCNRAFRLVEDRRSDTWCGNCPKCRFVFLMLAPYLPMTELERIFSGNLLKDGTQLAGFRELLGIEGHKPLECVGEIEESRLALQLIVQKEEWKQIPEVQVLLGDLPEDAWPTPAQAKDVFAASPQHFIPNNYQEAMHAIE